MKTKWSDTSLDSEEKSGALLHRNVKKLLWSENIIIFYLYKK